MKNGDGEPVQMSRYGNARLVTNEPTLPAMFIVPDTTPAWLRPMSMQNAQEGGSVMSAPNTAIDSSSTFAYISSATRLPSRPAAASTKPIDRRQLPREPSSDPAGRARSTAEPPTQLPMAPPISGADESRPACVACRS